MNTLQVFRQGRTTAKLATASWNVTLVWPNARVRAAMAREGARVCKSLLALGACKGSGAGVDVDVHRKCTALDKALVTAIKWARVWPLLGMGTNVPVSGYKPTSGGRSAAQTPWSMGGTDTGTASWGLRRAGRAQTVGDASRRDPCWD